MEGFPWYRRCNLPSVLLQSAHFRRSVNHTGLLAWRCVVGTVPIETLAEDMFNLVTECTGKKNLKAGDLTKAMIEKYGAVACSKDECKQAIRLLIDSGRCVYSY